MDTKLKAALMKARSLKRDEKRRMYFLLVPKSGTEGKLVVSPRQINTTQINVAKKAAGCNRIVKGTCCGGEGNTLVFEIVTQPRRAYATLVRKLAKVEAGFMVQAEFVQAEAKEVEETSVEELTDVERRDRLIQQWVERINDDDIKEFLLQHEGQQPGKDLHKLMHEGNKLSQEGEREKVEEIIDQIDLLVKKGVQEQQQGFLDTRRGKVVAKLPAYRAKVKELRDLVTEVQKLGEAPKVEYLKVSENKQVQEIIAKRFEAQTRLSAGLPTVRKFMKEVDLARRGGPRDQVATDLGVFHQHLTKLAQDVSDTLGNLQQRLIQEEPDHGLIWMARHMKIYRHADYPVREKELLAQHAGFDKELKSLRADFGQIPLDQQPSLFAALEDRVQQAGEALLRERKALGVIEGSLRSNPLEKLMDKDKARTTPEVVFKNLERFGALFEDRADKLTGLAAEARKEQNRILERLKDLKEHFGKRLGQVAQLQGIVDKLPTNGVGLARKDLDAVRHKVAKCEHTFQDAEMLSPDFPLQSRDQLKAALLTIRALLRRVDAIEEKLPEGPDTGSGQQPDNDPGGSKQRAAEYLKARVTKVLQSLKSYHALVKQLSDERQLLQLDKMAQDEIYSDEGVAKVVQARDTAARSLPVVNRYINELRVTARYLKDNEPQAYQKAEKTLDDLFQLLDTERQHTEFNLQECDKLLTQSGGVVARILAKQARTGKALTRENLQGRIKEHQDREKSFKEEWRLLKAAESNAELQGDDLTAFGNRLKLALGLLDKEKVGLSVVAKELQDYKPGLFTSADPQQQALRNLAVYQKFLDERIVALAALQKKVGGVGQDLGSQQQFEKQIVPQFQQKTQDLDTQAAIYLNLGTERRLDDLLKLRKRLEDHLKIGQNLTKFGAYLAQPDGDPVAAGIDSLNKRLRELKDAEPTIRKQEAERLDRLDQEQPITRQLSRTNDSGMEHLVKSKEANDQAVLNEHAVLAKQIDDFLNEVRPQMKEKIARLNNAGKEKLSDDALRALMLDLARDRAFFTSKDALCSQLIERVEALQRAVTGSGVGYDKRDKNMSVAQARLQVEIIGFAKTLKSSLKDLQGIQDNMQKGLTKINALQSQNFSLQLQSSLARHGKLYTQSEI
ncbi:MAG: hypothetical protein JNM56_25730, partial [Planctomycetia bacterium]|nr:hypothetical protein [Planctomycetia bacterium]